VKPDEPYIIKAIRKNEMKDKKIRYVDTKYTYLLSSFYKTKWNFLQLNQDYKLHSYRTYPNIVEFLITLGRYSSHVIVGNGLITKILFIVIAS